MLDLKLPLVDGLEVVARVRADPRTQYVPIVIMTGSREEQNVVAGYKLGVNSYIIKPVNFDRFTEALEELGLYWMVLNARPKP